MIQQLLPGQQLLNGMTQANVLCQVELPLLARVFAINGSGKRARG
jgi:hypothetical protein